MAESTHPETDRVVDDCDRTSAKTAVKSIAHRGRGVSAPATQLWSLRGLGGDVAQGIDDTVDDFLDQHPVIAFAHDPDHRLGARGTNDEATLAVEAAFRLPDRGTNLGGLQRFAAPVAHVLEHLRQ